MTPFGYAQSWQPVLQDCDPHQRHLGSGSYGDVFIVDEASVVKITIDEMEYCIASALVGESLAFNANIIDTIAFGDGYFGILVERVVLDANMEQYYSELEFEADAQACLVTHIDTDALITYPSWRALELLDVIIQAGNEIAGYTSYAADDLHAGNAGVREDGSMVLFDQRLSG